MHHLPREQGGRQPVGARPAVRNVPHVRSHGLHGGLATEVSRCWKSHYLPELPCQPLEAAALVTAVVCERRRCGCARVVRRCAVGREGTGQVARGGLACGRWGPAGSWASARAGPCVYSMHDRLSCASLCAFLACVHHCCMKSMFYQCSVDHLSFDD